MKLDNITGVIFDLGGTLFKTVSDMCGLTRDFLSDSGVGEKHEFPDDDIIAATMAPDEWLDRYMIENNVDIHWKPDTEHWMEYDRRLLAALGIENREDIVIDYQAEWDSFHEVASPELMKGCKECLEELKKRGFKLGIASNRFTDPTLHLQNAGIHHLFEAVEYTNVPGYRKPSPYLLVKIASVFGTNPQRCVFVGNIVKYDVVAATNAGMIPILLTWLDPEEIEKITSDTIVIEHIEDLLEIL